MCNMLMCAGMKTHVCMWRPEEDVGCLALLAQLGARLPDRNPQCSTINKNPETEIGIQPEGQKSKTVSHWLLPQSEMSILPPGISE